MAKGHPAVSGSNRAVFHAAFVGALVVLLGIGCGRRAPRAEVAEPGGQPAASPEQLLPDSAFRLRWAKHNVPPTAKARATVAVEVAVTNESTTTWPDPPTADASRTGAYAVRLGYRWLNAVDDTPAQEDNQVRVDLPKPLGPGESVTLTVPITVPGRAGNYRLQFDMVQELVAWFEAKGAAKLIVPVTVQ